ncbi:hypothetical protein TWF594_003461 [Orbilia oligospora]|uniref:Nucleoside phosphorylase domain-containing protein n=1 Tax=Orbilia oligospora TaxID=2813651 RepID=A0A7C8P856_ORBOL|nr:hypothetical protein TWF594_003461 [Orbilia oligospora]KAF3138575.1 hypothetical protein TWF703_004623 [Orbilia oligospora]
MPQYFSSQMPLSVSSEAMLLNTSIEETLKNQIPDSAKAESWYSVLVVSFRRPDRYKLRGNYSRKDERRVPEFTIWLMVGIGGGVPGESSGRSRDVRLGDVVVSQPASGHGGVIQYDFGKSISDGFVNTGFLNAPPQILLQALTKVQARHLRGETTLATHLAAIERHRNFRRPSAADVLFKATYEHVSGETCKNCKGDEVVDRELREGNGIVVHYGTIASGNRVMKDARERDRVSAKFNGILCFEMEAAGLMNSFPCVVIRGIADYADSHKNKNWQPYAAATAAAYAKEFLSAIPARPIEDEIYVSNTLSQ